MALTITKLKMWKDPGYTRNCLEVPPAGSTKLPATPDYTLAADDTLRPHKGSTLTELHLPLSFTQTFGMSYLYIEATDGAGSVSLFGWITSIDQRSTAAEGVTIRWDVDWWRSYSGSVTWGSGIVSRCSDSSYKRPYRTRPRYMTYSSTDMYKLGRPYTTDKFHNTVIITTVITENGASQIKQFFYSLNLPMAMINDTSILKGGLSMAYTYRGYIDEALTLMGYDFEIISVYVTPVGPDTQSQYISGYGWTALYNNSIYEFTSTVTLTIDGTPHSVTFITPKTSGIINTNYAVTISGTGITPDDNTSFYMVDFNGNKIGEIPYGITIKEAYVDLDVGGNGGYLTYTFPNSANGYAAKTNHAFAGNGAVGCSFTIPLPSVPVTSNYWSSYVISGQRDYDVTNARIANDQKAVSGLESSFGATVGGAVAGASAGPLGAIGGAIGGLVGGLSMTGISYALGENFNDQLQDARDRLYSNQTNTLQLSGDSPLWSRKVSGSAGTYNGPYLMILHSDSVSAAEYTNDISLNGYETNISTSSVSSFISAGGPLQIRNLNVTGNAPPQAKQYIKDKLSAGVYIVENNPSGVTP